MTMPTTNAEFMGALFGPLPPDRAPRIVGFVGNPKDPTAPKGRWAGDLWAPGVRSEGLGFNWYFTLSTFGPGAGRKATEALALHGVMLDDVGTKATELQALPPTYSIETSPGNFQFGYLFPVALNSPDQMRRAELLLRKLTDKKHGDKGAKSAPTRYCRLPFASNGKRSPPVRCRLAEFDPARRYTLDQIAAAAGVVLDAANDTLAPVAPATVPAEGTRERRVLRSKLRRALPYLDLNDREVWSNTGQNLKCLGADGYELWYESSAMHPLFNPDDMEGRWAGFGGDRSDFRSVLKNALAKGWDALPDAKDVGFGQGVAVPVALPQAPPPAPPFREVVFAGPGATEAPPQEWWWGAYVPAGQVTMLSGHGGAGKSFLALVLAVHIALGRPYLGQPVKAGRVVFFSAEDPGDVIRRRLAMICRALAVDPAGLADRMRVLDATEGDPVLFTAPARGVGTVTTSYRTLSDYITTIAADVVVIDNGSDVFDGDEIHRATVRAFVRSLATLARLRNGAVLLLAHVDKQTSRNGRGAGGESYSGSTAWHNSVRSRLFYRETNPGQLELVHEKLNLGPRGPTLQIAWPSGGLPQLLAEPVPGAAPGTRSDANLRAVLRLLAEFYDRGEFASCAPNTRTSAASILKGAAGYPVDVKNPELAELLREGQRRMLLEQETYRDSYRKDKQRWRVTTAGKDFAATAPSAASEVFAAVNALGAPPAASAASAAGGYGGLAHSPHLAHVPATAVSS